MCLNSVSSSSGGRLDKSRGFFDKENILVKHVTVKREQLPDRRVMGNQRMNPALNQIIEENSDHSG